MQLTIDIKDSAIDKVMYLLENLKSDVKIIDNVSLNSLNIEEISKEEEDYKYITSGRKDRKENPQNYISMNDIDWN